MFTKPVPYIQNYQFRFEKQFGLQKLYDEINLIDNNIIYISYNDNQRYNDSTVSTKKTFFNVLKMKIKYGKKRLYLLFSKMGLFYAPVRIFSSPPIYLTN